MKFWIKICNGNLIKALKFKIACFKVKHSTMKLVKCDIKILKYCIHHINKIGIPTNEHKNEMLKMLLACYDEAIKQINEDIEKYRSYVWQ